MKKVCMGTALLGMLFFIGGPVLWMVLASFKTNQALLQVPVQYWPNPFTIENYHYAWINSKFSDFFINSLIVSTVTSVVVMLVVTFSAYALSRYSFRGKGVVLCMLFVTQIIPGLMLLTPIFDIFNAIGLVSTLTGLILLFIAFQLPFNTLLMISFVDSIPYSLEEAAKVDGCSLTQIVIKIVFPLLRPGFIAVAAFAFIMSWNEYLFPVIFINDPAKFTISIGIGYMIGAYGVKLGALAAGSMIAMVLPLGMFAVAQKYLVAGIAAGAVKE